jgi:hypothetical protein
VRRVRGDDRVELAGDQHVVERAVGQRGDRDARRRRQRDALDPSRLVRAGLEPFDVGDAHAVLVLEQAARVDGRGLRPLRHADPAAG